MLSFMQVQHLGKYGIDLLKLAYLPVECPASDSSLTVPVNATTLTTDKTTGKWMFDPSSQLYQYQRQVRSTAFDSWQAQKD